MSAFCLLGGLFWEVCFILPNRLQWQSSLVVQQVKDLALSLLWHRFAAAVWVQSLAWELLHTTDALKKKKFQWNHLAIAQSNLDPGSCTLILAFPPSLALPPFPLTPAPCT